MKDQILINEVITGINVKYATEFEIEHKFLSALEQKIKGKVSENFDLIYDGRRLLVGVKTLLITTKGKLDEVEAYREASKVLTLEAFGELSEDDKKAVDELRKSLEQIRYHVKEDVESLGRGVDSRGIVVGDYLKKECELVEKFVRTFISEYSENNSLDCNKWIDEYIDALFKNQYGLSNGQPMNESYGKNGNRYKR